MRNSTRFLVLGVMVAWFLVGFLLLPWVEYKVLNSGVRGIRPAPPLDYIGFMLRGIRGFIYLAIVPALAIVVIFAGKARGVFERLMSGMLFIFHTFPTVACSLTDIYGMFFPTGIYIFLSSPWNPIDVFHPTEDPWLLLASVPLPSWLVYPSEVFGESYFFFGMLLFLIGLSMFAMILMQQLKRRGRTISRFMSVVRHPRLLGLTLTAFGFSLMMRRYSFFCWVGMFLFLVGLEVFTAALIQLLRGKGLITSGLYSVVRHPQYLGLILTTLGFSLTWELRLMSFVAWITLIFGYILLADMEETDLKRKYGKGFLSYQKRVPFILPLFLSLYIHTSKGTMKPWMPTSKLKKYTFLLCIYLLTIILTTIILRAYSIYLSAFSLF